MLIWRVMTWANSWWAVEDQVKAPGSRAEGESRVMTLPKQAPRAPIPGSPTVRAAKSAWIIAAANVTIMGLFVAALVTWAAEITGWLVEDGAEVVDEGVVILRVVGPSYVFAALGVVMGRALDGAGDTMPAMWVNLITLWLVQVPVALVLTLWLDFGTVGVWTGVACANVLNGVIFAFWFLRGSWKKKRV